MDKIAKTYVGLCDQCHSIQRYNYDTPSVCTICKNPLPSWIDKTKSDKPEKPDLVQSEAVASLQRFRKVLSQLQQDLPFEKPRKLGPERDTKEDYEEAVLDIYEELDAAGILGYDKMFDKPEEGLWIAEEILEKHGIYFAEVPQIVSPHPWDVRGDVRIPLEWPGEDVYYNLTYSWMRTLEGNFAFSVTLSAA